MSGVAPVPTRQEAATIVRAAHLTEGATFCKDRACKAFARQLKDAEEGPEGHFTLELKVEIERGCVPLHVDWDLGKEAVDQDIRSSIDQGWQAFVQDLDKERFDVTPPTIQG